nr:PHD and RING finger domain protein [Aspergillus niger CBS 513.88]|eukprot:XP_001402254.2 PHD and RING finger domain protein [Aspergillus niger CBS 513.88]
MSDTCIVCLGDLGESASDPLAVAAEAAPRLDLGAEGKSADTSLNLDGVDGTEDSGQIAQLLPCGHILHNNCLKPWVERANSCPICRRSFNMVELSDRPGGPVTSSYAVQDRVQQAEVDPSMIIEYIDDDFADFQPCPICGDADNEELLLLCDGCDVPSHTYCVGLDSVPTGPWYCARCVTQRRLGRSSETADWSSQAPDRRGRRTRAQRRRLQSRNQLNSLHWARVWQSVWDHLNLDLDFPFDDDMAAERARQEQRREEAHQRDFRAWQRRFEVAEQQGGGNRFRDTAALLDIEAPRPSRPRVPREPTPEPESLEEMRAWNAFERAREIENDPSAARKRKEPTLSPSPEPTEPERKLKRPRTRRAEDLAARAMQNGESSRSLLKEVEESSNPNGPLLAFHLTCPVKPFFPASIFRHTASNPPKQAHVSLQLGSPADPSSPPFSPDVSPAGSARSAQDDHTSQVPTRRPNRRIPRSATRSAAIRSDDSSPSRPGLSLKVKSDIQKLVGSSLKPYYRSKTITKEQYTEINRNISRKLYERAGDVETLGIGAKATLATVAKDEVEKAIDALKQLNDLNDSVDDSS